MALINEALKWSFRVMLLTGVILILHKFEAIEEDLKKVKNYYNVTTEFVVINPCVDKFDVRELNGRN